MYPIAKVSHDDRYCTNCRAELPRGATECPQCGTFAGDVFDGRIAKPKRHSAAPWLALAILAAAGVVVLRPWKPKSPSIEPPSARVVSVRPGGARRAPDAKLSEPEAMRALSRHLASASVSADCLVISSQGWREGAYRLTALNRCAGTRLGRFRVDVNSGAVVPE